ncbi:MAG: hypothetical protein U5K38_08300 [Woeseiaceae bacterium]|nr:hypothetical protein [Woeseiaceae bacterium]
MFSLFYRLVLDGILVDRVCNRYWLSDIVGSCPPRICLRAAAVALPHPVIYRVPAAASGRGQAVATAPAAVVAVGRLKGRTPAWIETLRVSLLN